MGDTDSEVLFFLFLSALEPFGPLAENSNLESISCALKEAVNRARALCELLQDDPLLVLVLWGLWMFHEVRSDLV